MPSVTIVFLGRSAYLMRVAICDDDKNLRETLKRYTEAWAGKKGVSVTVTEYEKSETFLFHWSPAEHFDLLFLDIQMADMTGMELAEVIRKIDKKLPIAFVTGSKDYVFDGYRVGAINYLLKPVSEKDCANCLDRIYEDLASDSTQYLLIASNGKTQKLYYHDIYYFESFAHDIVVHTKNAGTFAFRKNISELESELAGTEFIRTHRSFLVNMNYVSSIKKTELTMENGANIQISRANWKLTNNAFIRQHI